MVKAPWNRNRNRPSAVNIPSEVEEYYQSTQNERRGVAWLLSLATLALTLLIAGAIFFGVKWAYRKFVTGNNSDSTTTNQTEESQSNNGSNSTDDNSSSNSTPTESENQDNHSSSTLPGNNTEPNNQSPNNTPTVTPPQPNINIKTTPVTGPETPELPHTGPTSND